MKLPLLDLSVRLVYTIKGDIPKYEGHFCEGAVKVS